MLRPLAFLGAALAAAFALAVTLVVLVGVGALNGAIPGAFHLATGRTLGFRRLNVHLLRADPVIVFDDLVIGSPPAITRDALAHVAHGELHARLLPLFTGRLVLTQVALTGADLDLVRLGHGRNNYSFGGAGMSAALHAVTHMTIEASRVRYTDPERQLSLDARAHYDSTAGERPLVLVGGGVDHGEAYTVSAHGEALTGRNSSQPYAFDATMVDGAAKAAFAGVSQKPFDFRGFDLRITASGPNITDLGYLFGLSTPNTPAFTLSTHAQRSGHVVHFTDIVGRFGDSDVTGDFTSDHSQPRRVLSATLRARTLRLQDAAVMFTPRATHAAARSASPVVDPGPGGLAKSRAIDSQGLRTLDVHVDVRAARIEGAPLPLTGAHLKLDLVNGRLTIAPLFVSLTPGALTVKGELDARSDTPSGQLTATLAAARIERLAPAVGKAVDGDLDATADLASAGATTQALISGAHGTVAFRLRGGSVKRSAAAALAGDPLRAAWMTFVAKSSDVALTCARGRFALRNGVATPTELIIDTAEGEATGSGRIDFAGDRLDMTFGAAGARPALSAPVHLDGPLAHPKATVNIKPALNRAGLGAIGAILATPFKGAPPAPVVACPPPG